MLMRIRFLLPAGLGTEAALIFSSKFPKFFELVRDSDNTVLQTHRLLAMMASCLLNTMLSANEMIQIFHLLPDANA